MIVVSKLNKIYNTKTSSHQALKDVNLILPNKGLVFVLGKSGSGKSTFLNLIGGLDRATSGSIVVDGNDISGFTETQFVDYRNTCIGYCFCDACKCTYGIAHIASHNSKQAESVIDENRFGFNCGADVV